MKRIPFDKDVKDMTRKQLKRCIKFPGKTGLRYFEAKIEYSARYMRSYNP